MSARTNRPNRLGIISGSNFPAIVGGDEFDEFAGCGERQRGVDACVWVIRLLDTPVQRVRSPCTQTGSSGTDVTHRCVGADTATSSVSARVGFDAVGLSWAQLGSVGGRNMYPTPRIVWIIGSRPASIFLRR